MPSHAHLIASAGTNLHAVMRDFKRFTSRSIHEILKEHNRTTILDWLAQATHRSGTRGNELGLWQPGFHPQALYSRPVCMNRSSRIFTTTRAKRTRAFSGGLDVQLRRQLLWAKGS